MGWKDTIQNAPTPSWRDTVTDDKPPEAPSALGAELRGIAAGATAGFDDEIQGALGAAGRVAGVKNLGSWKPFAPDSHLEYDSPTLDKSELVKAYVANRNAARGDKAQDSENFPGRTMAANVGGSLISPASKLGLLGGGAAFGLGDSNADLTEGDVGGAAKDAAKGAGTAAVLGKVIEGASNLAESYGPKILSKLGRVTSGAPSDALMRQYERPLESAAADSDGFAHQVSGDVMDAIAAKGTRAGKDVGEAQRLFMKGQGSSPFEQAKGLGEKVDDFLVANKPSPQGFSAISPEQSKQLADMAISLKGGTATGEDVLKFRQYLDHVEGLAGQYDKAGSSPFVRFLKELRHDADKIVDTADPRLDAANRAFSQHAADQATVGGATREATAEGFANNLYSGANKKGAQAASSRLLSDQPELLEKMKDIAANKAITGAARPGFGNYFRHGALPVMTMGASELVTNPELWKTGFRQMGKYAPALAAAAKRGPNALAATNAILLKDPDYASMLQEISSNYRKISNE